MGDHRREYTGLFPLTDILSQKELRRLDGARALAYCRMRYDDPNGDFGRSERRAASHCCHRQKGLVLQQRGQL
ncbi:MAG: LCP family protein [Clostridia bacterium]